MAASTDKQAAGKLRVLLVPFFAASHIGPFTDLAFHLAAARPGAIEATIAVTPANEPVVRRALARRGADAAGVDIKVATYPFPVAAGLPPGVESLCTAAAGDASRIIAASLDEALTRPPQERLIRELSPDAVINDMTFFWNAAVAADLGVPCVTFHAVGAFSMLAVTNLTVDGVHEGVDNMVTIPRFPGKEIRVPITELPETTKRRRGRKDHHGTVDRVRAAHSTCLGLVVNTFAAIESEYCDAYVRSGYAKRAYMVGPLSLPSSPSPAAAAGDSPCIGWLGSKPRRSVLYVCFGSLAHVSDSQLHELALGLEASGKPFLWVVRAAGWCPPEGWEERVGERGMVVTSWAPQAAILGHPAVGAFLTHCGWNSFLETVAAGVPVLTWPMVHDQFIAERFATEVLGFGERLWPEGAGVRSTTYEEKEVVPAEAVARAVAAFMGPGGAGAAGRRAEELAVAARAAVAQGGSSHRDLHRLIDDLEEARAATDNRVAIMNTRFPNHS